MTRNRTAALTAAVAVIALAGCGEREEPLGDRRADELTLLLDFFPNADHAGIYAAQANGHFEEVGLDVEIQAPPDPAGVLRLLAAGRADIAISYEPEVLRARDQGQRIASVAALVNTPLTSLIWLPESGVSSIEDLEGKTVGTAGIDYQEAFLETILEEANVDPGTVEVRNIGFDFARAMISGRVDATLGGFWNFEGTQLEQRGRDPKVTRVERVGVPEYDELVLAVNEESLERDGDRIRRFIAALARGTRDLARDPRAGIRGLLEANREASPRLERAALRRTLPYLVPEEDRPYGYQDRREWEAFADWMRDNGLIERIPDVSRAFTNRFLPES